MGACKELYQQILILVKLDHIKNPSSMGSKRRSITETSKDVDLPGDMPALPVPPDGGWGWMVCAASFFMSLIVDGCCYSYGIFYMEYLDYFKASKAKTTLVGALLPGCYLLVGE